MEYHKDLCLDLCSSLYICFPWDKSMLDSDLASDAHIKNISRVAFCHLRNISKIRKMLSLYNAEKLVHGFVTSRLDTAMLFCLDVQIPL